MKKHILNYKNPGDYFDLTVNFADVLESGETLESGSIVIAFDSDGNEVSGSTILDTTKTTYSNTNLQTFVQSGSVNSDYEIVFRANTTLGKWFEESVYVLVR